MKNKSFFDKKFAKIDFFLYLCIKLVHKAPKSEHNMPDFGLWKKIKEDRL